MEILHDRKFNISHLRVFGYTCYVHLQRARKSDPHARKCIFVGYSSVKKGYKCYDPQSQRIYIFRDILFDEENPFFKPIFQGEYSTVNNGPCRSAQPSSTSGLILFDFSEIEARDVRQEDELQGSQIVQEEIQIRPGAMQDDELQDLQEEPNTLSRSDRTRKPPEKFSDFVMGCTTRHPIQSSIRYDRISMKFWSFLTAVDINIEPESFEKVREKEVWVTAMNEELNILTKNYT
jgi:hypothetical protein